MKETVARRTTALLGACGAMGSVRRLLGGQGVILMLHEVDDDPGPGLSSASRTATLDWTLRWLKAEGWDIVGLDEGRRRLEGGGRRFAVFTFDDGYRDTLSRALPVMERHGAPFTVYVPTAAVTRELRPWWLGLRALFLANDAVEIEPMGTAVQCAERETKQVWLDRVTAWVHGDYAREAALDAVFRRYGISLADIAEQSFLDADGVRTLARHPLVSIGGHGVSHRPLALLPAEEAAGEIAGNRTFLQELVDQPVDHLAYPYGNPKTCGPREAALAVSAGYRTAVTTRQATVRRTDDPLALPRIRMPAVTDAADFDGRVSGLYFAARGAAGRLRSAVAAQRPA